MARKYDKYEMEIIVSLGALILFLISINFISGYSFEKAVREQASQFENSLNLAADFMQSELEKDIGRWMRSEFLLLGRLRDLSSITGIDFAAVTDSAGNELASLNRSDQIPDSAADVALKRPLKHSNGRVIAYLRINEINKTGRTYKVLSRWDVVFRVIGVISALVISFFFIRSILNPYRKIKHEALSFNNDFIDVESGKGIEYIVNTFKEVIDELEEKKRQLEIMYANSEKRADSLARYNDYILGSITSGVVICDSTGTVTRFNRSAEKILKFFEKDCRGKQYTDIFGPDHRLTSLLDDALRNRKTHSRLEFEIKRPDGEKLWLGCSSSMINDEKGEGMGAVLLMIDLTEIRRLQELSSYSEKMASLGELSAGLAHEIRNSFAAVQGFARLLKKRGNFSDKDLELIEAILSESDSTESLLSRFLNFARPLDYCPQAVDMNSIIESALRKLAHANLDRIRIEKRLDSGLPPTEGDPVLLLQAFNNILLNALEALPDGGRIILETSSVKYKFGRAEIILTIADDGVGIEPDRLDKIFDPFHTDKPDGTGLGLALVKKIIVLHEGRIEVKSRLGKGTRFTVYLPLAAIHKSDASKSRDFKTPALSIR